MEEAMYILENYNIKDLSNKVVAAYKEWQRLVDLLAVKEHMEDEKR
jgi:hypothetical protein